MSIYSPLSAALVTFVLSRFLLSSQLTKKLHDVPNERSLHSVPVPRIGGVSLVAGIFAGWIWMYSSVVWWVAIPMLGLFVISLLDDIYNLTVLQRLLSHLVAGVVLVAGFGIYEQYSAVIAVAMLLLSVWMTNLYNFMDGSDGLAGGMAFFGFGMYGIAAWLAHNSPLMLLNFSIAAAAISFLLYNFHPAKLFMGDAGSIPLGFLVMAMGVWGWQQGCWEMWFPFMVFSPFIVDASVTLLTRSIRGIKITDAHREHYYQRLIQLGWGHRNVALVEYLLMLTVGLSALQSIHDYFPWQMFLVWGAIYACLMLLLDARWKSFKRGENV